MDKEGEESPSISEILAIRGTAVLETALKYGAYVAMAYYAKEAIEALAGKTTLVNAVVGFLGQQSIGGIIQKTVMLVAIVWAMTERRERRRKTRYFSSRLQKLEIELDKKRTSSGILPDGTTNPKDRL